MFAGEKHMDRLQTAGLPEGTTWHSLDPDAVLQRLGSTPDGLSSQQAGALLLQYGPNRLPAKPPPSAVEIFLHQFLSPLIYILIAAGVISLMIGEMTDACFIFAVILLNAGLGTFQEWKAEQSAASLQQLLRITSHVLRDRQLRDLPAEELVPGDVVKLESGVRVPADLRLLEVSSLSLDESLLTGESQPVAKQVAAVAVETPLSERHSLCHAGSSVARGRGIGVVVTTGQQTEVGHIAAAVASTAGAKPPLVIRMERFARQVSYLVLGFVVLLAVLALWEGLSFAEVFFMAVALSVSAIPEGLPVAMTVALSIATTRMARRNVIVRRLTAVEGLGSCTCIASDKTGTLTVNRQTVRALWLPDGSDYLVSGEGYAGVGEVTRVDHTEMTDDERGRLLRLGRAGVLCNEASLKLLLGEWIHRGDTMDIALLALGHKLGLDPEQEMNDVTILGEIPFESEQRYAARFVQNQEPWCLVKGALEQVLDFCGSMLGNRGPAPIDLLEVEAEAMRLADAGYRVLAVADGPVKECPAGGDFDQKNIDGLTLLGLVGFIDPLRHDVVDAVATCRRAGVRVVMVTGDHPATAFGIANELGLSRSRDEMVTGVELADYDPEGHDYRERVARSSVFARVTPIQKLQIVNALNRLGHFTAVTGDGVNDAPALRTANIGVAMGTGTDVAKETASIIIADDNFTSIVAGIEEGRFAYDNIRKVIYLLISTGGAEIVLFSLALVCGLPLPLGAVQLLWLNLVTNGIQDVALAFEGGEPGEMRVPPRSPEEGLFNPLMIQQTMVSGLTMGLVAFGCWAWLLDQGWAVDTARNAVLLLMVLLENVHVFNCRSEKVSAFRVPLKRNSLLILGVLVAQGVHMLAMHWPFMQGVLGVSPIDLGSWLNLLGLALTLLIVMEGFKLLRKSINRPRVTYLHSL
jgi:magnesium-transporting ATPase (P-type)